MVNPLWVKCADGQWYLNPVWVGETVVIAFYGDDLTYFRAGSAATWRTVVKTLTPLGIRASPIGEPEPGEYVFGERLVPCTCWKIAFRFPPPPPQRAAGRTSEDPC